jgi:hypothetical protein
MVQVQSTWFPVIDRNPQKYVDNIFQAKETDFCVAHQKIYRSGKTPSHVVLPVLAQSDQARNGAIRNGVPKESAASPLNAPPPPFTRQGKDRLAPILPLRQPCRHSLP